MMMGQEKREDTEVMKGKGRGRDGKGRGELEGNEKRGREGLARIPSGDISNPPPTQVRVPTTVSGHLPLTYMRFVLVHTTVL